MRPGGQRVNNGRTWDCSGIGQYRMKQLHYYFPHWNIVKTAFLWGGKSPKSSKWCTVKLLCKKSTLFVCESKINQLI